MGSVTWRGAQRAVVEETVGGVVAAAAHSSPGVSVVVRLTLLVKVGSRGLWEKNIVREETVHTRGDDALYIQSVYPQELII